MRAAPAEKLVVCERNIMQQKIVLLPAGDTCKIIESDTIKYDAYAPTV